MSKELFLLADKIKVLRESKKITQSDLARTLGLSRSAINAWEMGLSIPSTQYIVELAKFFNVSSDYLLNIHEKNSNSFLEDELLRIFRLITPEQQLIYIEQGKAFSKTHNNYTNSD